MYVWKAKGREKKMRGRKKGRRKEEKKKVEKEGEKEGRQEVDRNICNAVIWVFDLSEELSI